MKYLQVLNSRCLPLVLFLVAYSFSPSFSKSTHAQSPRPDAFVLEQEKTLALNPMELTFRLRLKDDKTTFHMGEIIGLELAFSSSVANTFYLNGASYDRSGRLMLDSFHLDQMSRVTDPLYDYFYRYVGMMGGLYGVPTLEAKPTMVDYELNEWMRFDKPGKFRLYVTSPRAARGKPFTQNGRQFKLTSNIVEFEILPPDSKWSQQKLDEVLKVLSSQATEDERRGACRTLRFLGTEASAIEMIKRYRGDDPICDFSYDFGLIGSPHRALVVSEMEKQIGAPEHPVTGSFIRTLSLLTLYLRHSPRPPYSNNDEAKARQWSEEQVQRVKDYEAIERQYGDRLAIAVGRKHKRALATSLNTIISIQRRMPDAERSAARERALSDGLVAVFSYLPPDTQHNLLIYGWQTIRSPSMLPILRQIYRKPPSTDEQIRDVALEHLYELAPDEGRQIILSELTSPHPRVGFRVLRLLPDKYLADIEALLVSRLEDGKGTYEEQVLDSALVNRYVSNAALPRLRAAFEAKIGTLACAVQTSLLDYFLRADSAFGVEMVKKAMASRRATGCYHTVLSTLSESGGHPELEELAVVLLDDLDAKVVKDAAGTLGKHGSPGSEPALWNRFEKWHQEWKGREKVLMGDVGHNSFNESNQIETALFRAIAYSPAWLADREKLSHLRELCVTHACRSEADSVLTGFGTNITIWYDSDDNIDNVSIGHYLTLTWEALKRKVTQFPKGTTFFWGTAGGRDEMSKRFFTELKTFLETFDMKLEIEKDESSMESI